MKKYYEYPDMEIILINEADIITSSDGFGTDIGIGDYRENDAVLGDC